ncbi:MAG: SDR family NAD(P)-dependent oxidoreductase [Caldilineaceae bacterium]
MSCQRVALVTGAGRAGRCIALSLAAKGWALVINYRGNAAAAAETASLVEQQGAQALTVQADIGAAADREMLVARCLEHFGRGSAGQQCRHGAPRQRTDILSVGEASYDEVMSVNLKGPFFLTQKVANTMIELLQQGRIERPQIINIGSPSAYASSPNRGEYCISKAGLSMMTASSPTGCLSMASTSMKFARHYRNRHDQRGQAKI